MATLPGAPKPAVPGLSLADRRTAHESVVEILRRAIVNGELPSGTRLIQSDLAAQLGTSTTPVREAIRDLVSEGLLEFNRHRGAIVHSPSPEELREIYAIRMTVEPLAMRAAAERIDSRELEAASELVDAMDKTDDVATFVGLNRRFHELLTEAAGLPRAAAILRTLRDTSALYVGASLVRQPDLMRSTNREHAEILGALRVRDADRAAELIVKHLHNTIDTLEAEEGS